jgi:hypothetical protein
VADDVTLFGFYFLVSYSTLVWDGTSTGHTLFLLGVALWSTLKMTGSLLTVELSCCDCLGLKSVDELCVCPNRTPSSPLG